MAYRPNTAIVPLGRVVDWTVSARLKQQFDDLLNSGCNSIVLNMSEVVLLDSAGMGVIIYVFRRLSKTDGHLLLINVSDRIMQVLSRARLLDLIPATGSIATRRSKVTATPAKDPELVITIQVPDDASCMARLRQTVSTHLTSFEMNPDAIFDLTLAFGEALGNAFCHGSDEFGHVSAYVTMTNYDDRVVVEVRDTGKGCSITDGDSLPVPSETRGRGIRLMYLLADSVQINRRERSGGTCVTLVKLKQKNHHEAS